MKSAGRTILQFLAIGLCALIVAFAANTIRADGSLEWTKNYFDTGASRLPPSAMGDLPAKARAQTDTATSPSPAGSTQPADTIDMASEDRHSDTPTARGIAPTPAEPPPSIAAQPVEAKLEHPYQDITFGEVAALVDDPLTQAGLNVFIDARTEPRFAEGRIPGAMLCNPYSVSRYLDRVIDGMPMIDHILNAEKVVVYCGGGSCEDSIFMARELLELDVPYDAIYIYAGGWSDWVANGGRVEKGRK